jgi:hypothetical protein
MNEENQKSIQQTGIMLSKNKPEKVLLFPVVPESTSQHRSHHIPSHHSAVSPEQSHKQPCEQHPPTFSTTSI